MNTIDRVELGEDIALLTGKIFAGNLEPLVCDLLTSDKRILARYHRHVTDPEVLKAILTYLVRGENNVDDSTVPFD